MPLRGSRLLPGLMLLLSAAVWRNVVAPRWTDRIPRGWSLVTRFAGVQTNADPRTGKLPARDVLGIYDRSIRILSDSDRPRAIRIEDALTIRDPATGQITFRYLAPELVDPRTGARAEPQFRGDIAVFPRQVERRTYRLRSNYVKGVPLAFERTDDVAGLATYVFSYHGRGEYGESYAGSPEFPGVRLESGQELRCADDQFYLRLWIEPVTGETVKGQEGCPSGDYVYDLKSGKPLYAVDRWEGLASGTDLLRRVERVQSERLEYLAAARGMPLLLVLGGIAFTGVAVFPRRRSSAPA